MREAAEGMAQGLDCISKDIGGRTDGRLKVTVCAKLMGSGLTTGRAKFTMGVDVQLPNFLLG